MDESWSIERKGQHEAGPGHTISRYGRYISDTRARKSPSKCLGARMIAQP